MRRRVAITGEPITAITTTMVIGLTTVRSIMSGRITILIIGITTIARASQYSLASNSIKQTTTKEIWPKLLLSLFSSKVQGWRNLLT